MNATNELSRPRHDYRPGETVHWDGPDGSTRLTVLDVLEGAVLARNAWGATWILDPAELRPGIGFRYAEAANAA